MKKIVSVFLIFALFCSMPITAFAEEKADTIEPSQLTRVDYEPGVVEVTKSVKETSIQRFISGNLNDGMSPSSTSKPTVFWNLSGGNNYYANLQVVGIAWLYTNYYFKPNANAKIRVSYTVYSDTHRPTQMKIGCYDHTLNRFVAYWTTAGAGGEGTSNVIDFYNLNTTHYYSIAFVSVFDGFTHDTLHGSAIISHP